MLDKRITINGTRDISGSIEVEFIPSAFIENNKLKDDAKRLYAILRTYIPARTYDYLMQLMNKNE